MAEPLQRLDPRQRAAPRSRRRLFLLSGLAALLLLLLLVLIGATFLLPRLRDRGGEVPNPIRMVKDWLFPPPQPVFVIEWVDSGTVLLTDDLNLAPPPDDEVKW
jgi:hypothetical protein